MVLDKVALAVTLELRLIMPSSSAKWDHQEGLLPLDVQSLGR